MGAKLVFSGGTVATLCEDCIRLKEVRHQRLLVYVDLLQRQVAHLRAQLPPLTPNTTNPETGEGENDRLKANDLMDARVWQAGEAFSDAETELSNHIAQHG